MKSRLLVTVSLAATLALPAFAQNTASQSGQSQPAATTQSAPSPDAQSATQNTTQSTTQNAAPANSTTSNSAASTSDTTHQPLVYESRQGFWGKINPFARKKYVQKQIQPIRDRMNELDELTAANSRAIKDVDSRAQEGIRNADSKATVADQHAVDAGNRAQAATQLAQQTTTRVQNVEQVVGSIDQYKPATQVEIRFRPGQMVLSSKAKAALDDLAGNLKNSRGYVVEVQGFSSGRGQAAISNSQRMAESVVRYLVENHEIPIYRIYDVGMGNAPMQQASTGTGRARRTTGGRVEVSLLKNGLEGLQTQSASAGNANPSGTLPASDQQYAAPAQPQYSTPQSAAPQQQYNAQPRQQQNPPAQQQPQTTTPH
jgi:outer membrane protein OmpA-like peptidoglycan-associated protein